MRTTVGSRLSVESDARILEIGMSPLLYHMPEDRVVRDSLIVDFMRYIGLRSPNPISSFAELERMSVADVDAFWSELLDWSRIPYSGMASPVCTPRTIEAARFFPCVNINYAECLLSGVSETSAAIVSYDNEGVNDALTGAELKSNVHRAMLALSEAGLHSGDVVLGITRNTIPAAVVAIACAGLGCIYASCSAQMTEQAILNRASVLKPKMVVAALDSAPREVGRKLLEKVLRIVDALAGVESFMSLDATVPPLQGLACCSYDDAVSRQCSASISWTRFPFNHPLFALFSSGTTGPPKAIIHGAGGTLLEHIKEHRLHCDLKPQDVLFFQTSPAWMMWQWQLSALASGATIVLTDGLPSDVTRAWETIAASGTTVFGTSAAFLQICQNEHIVPRNICDLSRLKRILSTGSILYEHQFDWAYEALDKIPLHSISGGTDIIGCFVLGCAILPICRGEVQCRSLGMDVRSLPMPGESLDVGELVCANPFPSRPLGFWPDPDGQRFRQTYFTQNPGFWTHGDLIAFTSTGSARILGRSDSTLKIGGVRVGPAELYSILSQLKEISASLAVARADSQFPGGSRLVLVVQLRQEAKLDASLKAHIRAILNEEGSTALVPTWIVAVNDLPRTFNGKYSEAAASDVLNERPVKNLMALVNPECLEELRTKFQEQVFRRRGPTSAR